MMILIYKIKMKKWIFSQIINKIKIIQVMILSALRYKKEKKINIMIIHQKRDHKVQTISKDIVKKSSEGLRVWLNLNSNKIHWSKE